MHIKKITLRGRTGRGNLERNRWSPKKARVYVFIEGESIWQNLQDRRQRPYNVYKKELLPKVAKILGLDLNALDLRWSQKAGCTCSCSPGFIDHSWGLKRDVFITVTDDSSYVVPKIDGDIPEGALAFA